jgi:glucose/arabinose dehydrogenase
VALATTSAATALGGPVIYVTTNNSTATSSSVWVVNSSGVGSQLTATDAGALYRGIAGGPDGKLYVADFNKGVIDQVNPTTGAVSTFISGLNHPYGVAWSGGNLFVSQNGLNKVSEFNSAGGSVNANFVTGLSNPFDIAFGTNGNLYVSNGGTNSLKEFNGAGADVTPGGGFTGINVPRQISFKGNTLFVADSLNAGNVLEFNATTGAFLTFVTNSGVGNPKGTLIDPSTGTLFFAAFNSLNPAGREIFSPDGNTVYSGPFAGNPQLNDLAEVAQVTAAVPEPTTLALGLVAGAGGLLSRFVRRRKANA